MATQLLDTNQYGNAIVIGLSSVERDEVLVFTGAATVLKGTLLGRVTASGKLKPFALGNNDGSQLAVVAVAPYDVVALGAGDVAARVVVRGDINRNRLVLGADGHGNNITPAILDMMRDYGLTPVDVQLLGVPTA